MRVLQKLLLVLVVGMLAIGVAACGDDETGGGDGSAPAADANGKKDPGDRTIGVIPSTAASEHLGVRIEQTQATFDALGWELEVCDGAGNPQTMEQCMQRLVSQDVDAIFTLALGGNEIPRGLASAKEAEIPVVAYITDPLEEQLPQYTGVFADGTVNMGKIAGEYIVEERRDIPVVGDRITQNFAGDGFIQGTLQVFEQEGVKFQDLRDTDLADIINSMRQNAQAIAQANEGELTYVSFNDFGPPIYLPAFERAGHDGDITVITRYDNPSTIKLMQQDAPILVVTTKGFQHIFDAADWLLAAWTENQPLERKVDVSEPEGGVYGKADIRTGAENLIFPFEPELEEQKRKWAETYALQG